MLEFEHGARVVIEASNEFWIEHIRDCFFRQRLFDERECLRAGLAEMVDDLRRVALQGLLSGVLGVE